MNDANQTTGSGLRPVLGLFSAIAIVVGGTIGSGVFFKPKGLAEGFLAASPSYETAERYVPLILGLWVLCGLANLCGALTLAELSTMMPQSGGNYLYLREAYGRLWAFLWSWAEFWVIRSGSNAALAAIASSQARGLLNDWGYDVAAEWSKFFDMGFSIALIALLTGVNVVGTVFGGAVQNITTVIKIGFVGLLAMLPFMTLGNPKTFTEHLQDPLATDTLAAAVTGALLGIMWAYDGWGMVTVVAEEIKNPKRNVPLALGGGVMLLTAIYFGANWAYHRTMSLETLATQLNAARPVTQLYLGDYAARLVQGMVMISVLGALNSNILVGPRVLFAAGQDIPFLSKLKRVDPRFGTPALAIVGLSVWTCFLILLGDLSRVPNKRLFDVMTDYCVFGGSLFYLAAVAAVFVLRRKRPTADRPYRTWGYPVTPLLFMAFYVTFIVLTVRYSMKEAIAGLSFIAAGIVPYWLWGERRKDAGGGGKMKESNKTR